jgi:transposase
MYWNKYWHKDSFMIPTPPLVCVELNPGPALSENQRQEIFTLRDKGRMSFNQIVDATGHSRRTVIRTLKKYRKKPSRKNLPGQGRKRKLTPDLMKRVKKKAKRKKSATKIAHEIKEEVAGGISERTVQRRIKETGFRYLVIEEVEELTPKQIRNRLQFAKERKDYDWEYELFADEKTWQLGPILDKCWQDPEHRIKTKKRSYPPKIHCWGAIGKHFKTKLYFFKQNLNSNLYCKILKKRLPPEPQSQLTPRQYDKWIFVQDNDPKHKSKQTTSLLDELAPDRLKNWPANSPDFNPIEDVWSFLQSAIKYKKIQSIPALQRQLTDAWNNLDMKIVRRSIESLPRRLAQCIERKGERTDY